MRRLIRNVLFAGLAGPMLLSAPPAMAQGQLAVELEGEPLRIRDLLQSFVDANVANYTAETERMSERLAGTVCAVGADGLPPLALPEPSNIDLAAFIPPRQSDVLAAGEHIDPSSVQVQFGHGRTPPRRIAADQETAEITNFPHGLPVRVTATAFRVRDGECSHSTTRTTSAGARETRIQKKRVSVRFGARTVDITDRLGGSLAVAGGFTFDRDRFHLTTSQTGTVAFPTISGKGAGFDRVVCDGGDRQVFSGDNEELRVRYNTASPDSRVAVFGLTKLQLGTPEERTGRHMITGPGAGADLVQLGLVSMLVSGEETFAVRVERPEAVEVALRRGPAAMTGTGHVVTVAGTGEAGTAEIAVSPAGSTVGSLVDVLELTFSRAALRIPTLRPFADEAFVAELAIDGPLPADSGMTVRWRARAGGRDYAGGDLDAPAGGAVLAIPVPAPPMEQVLRARGMDVNLLVEIRRGANRLFSAQENITFRPPPVLSVNLVGRRDGSSGALAEGPFDLFRVADARGVEIRLDVGFRDGSRRSFAPALAAAFGIQQSQGGGLLMADGTQGASVVRPRLLEQQPVAALRPVLRGSAAESTNFSPVPGTPLVQGEVAEFTLNDVLLVIDNLGANGFIWRLLVQGDADMSRYTARYVTSDGEFGEVFEKDGDGWVASRQFDARTGIRHVAITDAEGLEVARINQSQLGAITPRVSLEVPEIYRQGVAHPVTASISGLGGLAPFELVCQWSLQAGFGQLSAGSSRLTPVGNGFATCANSVSMDVNEATLGRFPRLDVRLVRLGGGRP